MTVLVTKRDVDIERLRERTAYAYRKAVVASVVRKPCMADRHKWYAHPEHDELALCDLCKFVRIHALRNKPKRAIKKCTRTLDGLIESTYRDHVEMLVAPYLVLRHCYKSYGVYIVPLVRLDLHGLRQWVPVSAGSGPTTWPAVMKTARKYVNEPPLTLFTKLHHRIYGHSWPSYLGPVPSIDSGVHNPEPKE